ncbi:MAG: type IV toxin-antitoxin system AbiEi family antitoxin domain-containing protein, partial [Actinomycetota bacterium]|nr:type IV toxin-antitoxin system AbiEi family antitoxin domain-containing protein [Actinomycetota bacterium]
MRPQDRTVEQELARIAGDAHGVVTRVDLLRAGVTPGEIKQRLRTGALLREHPGVYRVGHRAPSLEARYLAAVRACGDGALLSGRAAAHLLGVLGGAAPGPEVTAPTERRVEGVTTRRSRHMDARDATTWAGIPVTTVARTVVDLAAVLAVDDLARACHEAGVCHHTTPADVDLVLARRPGSPGAAKLRQILRGEVRVTLSKLEARFLARLGAADLALPQTNRPAGGRRVDCRWPEQRLTVELDSYRYHHSRHAWE